MSGGLLGRVAGVAAAAAFVGCGSSSDQAAKETTRPTPTAEAASLDRLPEVSAATEATQPPAPGDQFLRTVFDDVQAMWQREFAAAGIDYAPATMTRSTALAS